MRNWHIGCALAFQASLKEFDSLIPLHAGLVQSRTSRNIYLENSGASPVVSSNKQGDCFIVVIRGLTAIRFQSPSLLVETSYNNERAWPCQRLLVQPKCLFPLNGSGLATNNHCNSISNRL